TGAKWLMSDGRRMAAAERALPLVNKVSPAAGLWNLPGVAGKWTGSRDVPQPPKESFRSWWKGRTR
ncbi:(4Fe-4S)-binding protein, partial [Corynebacterium bovis]